VSKRPLELLLGVGKSPLPERGPGDLENEERRPDPELPELPYGAGMRLLEGLRLRVKDLDFDTGEVVVRSGKGNKDRTTVMPLGVRSPGGLEAIGR
jgi:site-specific recombinase XerC